MDGTDEDVLERMRDQADSFERMSDNRDDRVNGELQGIPAHRCRLHITAAPACRW